MSKDNPEIKSTPNSKVLVTKGCQPSATELVVVVVYHVTIVAMDMGC